jgi:cystathionine beta-lyase/cystathionine gamma-synthase
LEKSAANAEKIVAHFADHPKVAEIIYTFHPGHPQYELAKKQMKRGTGLFAMNFRTNDKQSVWNFCDRLQRFLLAVSWGGYESLVFPASIKQHSPYPAGFVRFYAGLEESDVLVADIEQALEEI